VVGGGRVKEVRHLKLGGDARVLLVLNLDLILIHHKPLPQSTITLIGGDIEVIYDHE